ncbi:EF-hand [Neocallimastix lanati (nom. inval.)]|uniref:EF-hand n=1 Tax=Neocallimastix californiae TaxID=1754190 RepID=A0A1Y2A7G4_9FUNG|nr:EF-hand [Neocallimastix sp. JGI-2020a]ORY18443.1 EF-hand [Neocallimastix californiae]|eukprot:ORY18443.1 EF-hand [Neocallimastix californiae]
MNENFNKKIKDSFITTSHILTNEQFINLKKIFNYADQESKGYLTKNDFKIAYIALWGYRPTKYEISVIKDNWPFDKKCVNFEVFCNLMADKYYFQSRDSRINQAFIAMDNEYQGYITLEKYLKIIEKIAPFINKTMAVRCFFEIDKKKKGKINYKEFENLMSKGIE